MVAIPLDCRKKDFGIVPSELPELEAGGYRAPKHLVSSPGCLRVMPHSFPISGRLHRLWGGPPGPQPIPWSASPGMQRDSSRQERDERLPWPRGHPPGGPPHNLRRTRPFRKLRGIVLKGFPLAVADFATSQRPAFPGPPAPRIPRGQVSITRRPSPDRRRTEKGSNPRARSCHA